MIPRLSDRFLFLSITSLLVAYANIAASSFNEEFFSEEPVKRTNVKVESKNTEIKYDKEELFISIQLAIFSNREKLLEVIRDSSPLEPICTPIPNGTYDEFQQSLTDRLDQLWYFETYKDKYKLSDAELARINKCASLIDEYVFNYGLYENRTPGK